MPCSPQTCLFQLQHPSPQPEDFALCVLIILFVRKSLNLGAFCCAPMWFGVCSCWASLLPFLACDGWEAPPEFHR